MPEDFEVEPDALKKIKDKAIENLNLSPGEKPDILHVGRGYLPPTVSDLPIICQVDFNRLLPPDPSSKIHMQSNSKGQPQPILKAKPNGPVIIGGVFINVG